MYLVEETDDRFYVKDSTIPNAGLGCFAKERIQAGDCLEVIGVYVKCKSPADICTAYANRYKFAARENFTYYIVPLGWGGMVNHTDDKTRQNVELRWKKGRSKKSQHSGDVVYVALRDIEADEELLGHYGEAIAMEIKWAAENAAAFAQMEKEWEAFLAWDLYNMALLKS